jgi:hypothetical protein
MDSPARHVNQGDADALSALRSAAEIVYQSMSPTLFRAWPLLEEATGVRCWVKHENHSAAALSISHALSNASPVSEA